MLDRILTYFGTHLWYIVDIFLIHSGHIFNIFLRYFGHIFDILSVHFWHISDTFNTHFWHLFSTSPAGLGRTYWLFCCRIFLRTQTRLIPWPLPNHLQLTISTKVQWESGVARISMDLSFREWEEGIDTASPHIRTKQFERCRHDLRATDKPKSALATRKACIVSIYKI